MDTEREFMILFYEDDGNPPANQVVEYVSLVVIDEDDVLAGALIKQMLFNEPDCESLRDKDPAFVAAVGKASEVGADAQGFACYAEEITDNPFYEYVPRNFLMSFKELSEYVVKKTT